LLAALIQPDPLLRILADGPFSHTHPWLCIDQNAILQIVIPGQHQGWYKDDPVETLSLVAA